MGLIGRAAKAVGAPPAVWAPAVAAYGGPRRVRLRDVLSPGASRPRCGISAGCPLAVHLLALALAGVSREVVEAARGASGPAAHGISGGGVAHAQEMEKAEW